MKIHMPRVTAKTPVVRSHFWELAAITYESRRMAGKKQEAERHEQGWAVLQSRRQ